MAFMFAGCARTSTPVKCGPPLLIPFTVALIYPMPSATGVPAGSLSIVIASRTQQLSVPVSISATQSAQGSPLTHGSLRPHRCPVRRGIATGFVRVCCTCTGIAGEHDLLRHVSVRHAWAVQAPMLMGQFTTQ